MHKNTHTSLIPPYTSSECSTPLKKGKKTKRNKNKKKKKSSREDYNEVEGKLSVDTHYTGVSSPGYYSLYRLGFHHMRGEGGSTGTELGTISQFEFMVSGITKLCQTLD